MRRTSIVGLLLVALCPLTAAPADAAGTEMTARTLLSKLTVASESHASTYERSKFRHWIDADRDRCNTRAEVLMAESTVRTTRSSTCTIRTGRWVSAYDGRVWTNASDVDVDHLVALSEAWQSGAWAWTATKRERFANDIGYSASLGAMTDNLNSSKGDRDPAQWLPPKTTSKCAYALRWMAVKYRWGLRIDTAERTALRALLAGSCGDRRMTVPARA